MDFFERQEKAHRKTKLLVFYFVLAVTTIVVACYFAALVIFAASQPQRHVYSEAPRLVLWNPQLFLGVTAVVLVVVVVGSAYKTNQLAGGGSSVATLMGGRPVSLNTTNPDERKLLNVVEEMAIASGVPVPKVYVLDNERAINAFAAGHTTSDAAIGVTRGCIQLLSRDQLQGVIGHEFSHILNGDMRLNLRLIGIIFGILCIATIGRILVRVRGSGRDRNPLPLLGLVLLLLGSIGVFFGRLIQAAVSRQREFLADASSVQFTRNPGGLSGALQKIGRYSFGSRLKSEHAPDLCHMFFGNGVSEPFFGLMATHPPIPDRIRAIDPYWDGKFPPLAPEQAEIVEHAALSDLKRSPMPDILHTVGTVLGGAVIAAGSAKQPPVIKSNSVLPNLGNPTPQHLQYAEQLRKSIPENVKLAAREPSGATALVYAMLLSADDNVRKSQLEKLSHHVAPGVCEETARLQQEVATVAARAKLPLVDVALPALRNLSPRQFAQFTEAINMLIEADSEIDLFEYVLQKVVVRHLTPHFVGARKPVVQYYSVKPLLPDCTVLLSAVAHVGQQDAGQIQTAFHLGWQQLRMPAAEPQVLPPSDCDLEKVDAALGRLGEAVPQIKKNTLTACAYAVAADGVIQEDEAELLRAIADTLDCPIPPFVEGVQTP